MDEKLLQRVCEAPGIPGYEDAAQAVVMEVLKGCCDEVRRDRLGNVIALRRAARKTGRGRRPLRVALAAHVDEIGLMVKHVNGQGLIHFLPLGGVHAPVIQSQRVVIHGREPVRGVVVPKGLGGEKEEAAPKVEDLLIDTGLSKEELLQRVAVGDPISFEADVSLLNGRVWVGRNFDDRIGTYCLLEAMRRVGRTQADVYAVSSVQEEVGLRGMRPAAFGIEADIGIAIDGSMARGAYVKEHENLCEPGRGVGIYLVDRLTIGHPRLVRCLCDLCERHRIPYQRNIGGGTDASAIQQSRAGVVATTIGAPVRYMHSTVQLCHADDMEATVRLLVTFMEQAHRFSWES